MPNHRLRNRISSLFGAGVGAAGAFGEAGPAGRIAGSISGPLQSALSGPPPEDEGLPRAERRARRKVRRAARKEQRREEGHLF